MNEFDADFSKELGETRPALLRLPVFIDLYNSQSSNPEFVSEFKKHANILWTDFISELNKALDENERFNLESWVLKQTDRIAIEEVHERMPLQEFIKPSIRMLILYYVLSNVQEIAPDVYVGVPQNADFLLRENDKGNLWKAQNFVVSIFDNYYDSYLGEINDKAEAERIRQSYLNAARNTASTS